MPFLFIRTCNSDFGGIDDGAEYGSPEDALAMGVRSAVGLAADEINAGERTAAVDVCIEDRSGQTVLRTVVAISVSPLIADPASAGSELLLPSE